MKKNLLFFVCLLFAFEIPHLNAQVEHKPEWKAVREIQAKAPEPLGLEKRIQNFEQRDSDAAVQQLASELFGLMNPGYVPENEKQASIYREAWTQFRQGKFREALETYKIFSFDRIRKPEMGVKFESSDPSKRLFIEFYNQPDELMRGVFRLQEFDEPIPPKVVDGGTDAIINYYRAGKHNDHMVDIILQNGMPGRTNWTYNVPGYSSGTWHIRDEKGFSANAYRQSMFFAPLLSAYLEKKDPAYLKQWVGYIEDHLQNYRKDIAAAGIKMPVNPSGAGGPDMRHLYYLVLNAPNIDKEFPATTYARLQLRHWVEDLPLIILGSRATGANRAMHMYGALLTEARMHYPEINVADSLLEDRRRILESYAREYMMPDGTSVDYAPNYNKNYILSPPVDIKFFGEMKNKPAWFSKEWVDELQRDESIMARYLIHSIAPDGTLPGYKDPMRDLCASTIGDKGYITKNLPQAITSPANSAVVSNLLGKSPIVDSGYTSEAFPYGGYYLMRENWNRDGRFLYFHDYRPGENGLWRHHKNIFVQAFGQRMLNSFRWECPLRVDDAGTMHQPFIDLYPESYQGKRGLFGSHAEHSAWREPLPNRWHTSSRFDLAEGNLKIPFAQKFDDKPSVFLDDVSHGRQVIYLREAGAWIITDRIRAEKPHEYKLTWGFEADRVNPVGWDRDWRNKGRKEEAPRQDAYSKEQIVTDTVSQAIRTQNPKRPNLSIYHAGSLPIRLVSGDIVQNNDSMFGNTYQAGPSFRADRTAVIASLLYPRRIGAPDISTFTSVATRDGAGFDAKTPDGVSVQYRAALIARELEAGKIKANATSLVLSEAPNKSLAGIALDCMKFSVDGKVIPAPSADFEFVITADGTCSFNSIYRPLPQVRILPESDIFLNTVDVTLESSVPDVDIRYTLDGAEPTLQSALYGKPIHLSKSTTIRASAFRRGAKSIPATMDSTLASIPSSAVFTKVGVWPATKEGDLKAGLSVRYYEDDWTLSILKLPIMKPLESGVSTKWMDIALVKNNLNSYALIYEGFLKAPKEGIYNFHGPWEFFDIGERAAYDLQIVVDGHVWYPATRSHNYGNWSVPLAEGLHSIKVTYVDLRRGTEMATFPTSFKGEKPEINISGPGISPQVIPSDWLFHK